MRATISALDTNDDQYQTVVRSGKSYLPILFKLYCSPVANEEWSDPDSRIITKDVRAAALETIRAFVSLASADLLHTYAKEAIDKLNDKNEEEQKRVS